MGLLNQNLQLRNVPLMDTSALSLAGDEVLTGAVANLVKGDFVDLGASQAGALGNDLEMVFIVETALTSGGSAVVQLSVEMDADGVDGSGAVVAWSQAFAFGSVPTVVRVPIPTHLTHQYVRANIDVTTAALTAGFIKAGIVKAGA